MRQLFCFLFFVTTATARFSHTRRKTIVNGSTAPKNKYEYASSIQYDMRHLCGASLIAPDILISAAHCLDFDHSKGFLEVVIGEYHIKDLEDGGEAFLVERIETHPQYLNEGNMYLENDIVIIKIDGKSEKDWIRLNKEAEVPMQINEDEETNGGRDAVTVVGWGSLDINGVVMSNVLQKVSLSYISNNECKERGVPIVTEPMLCATDLNGDELVEDSCYGDSGGPLISESVRGEVQVGIVSFGSKKCGEYPGVYTRISSFYEWLRGHVCDLSIEPPEYFLCDEIPATNVVKAPTLAPFETTGKGISSRRPSNEPSRAPTSLPSVVTKEPTSTLTDRLSNTVRTSPSPTTISRAPSSKPTKRAKGGEVGGGAGGLNLVGASVNMTTFNKTEHSKTNPSVAGYSTAGKETESLASIRYLELCVAVISLVATSLLI